MDLYVYCNPHSRLIVRFLLLFYLCLNTGSVKSCMEEERQALLTFKQHLTDPSGSKFSSWVGHECCRWRGISCNDRTGHVSKLDLSNTYPTSSVDQYYWNDTEYDPSFLRVKLNPSLLALKHLTYLDLSNNEFQETHIPNFIGQLTSLSYLNLSNSYFSGEIPPSLGNLSNLNYLDLNSYYNGGVSYSKNLNWLSHLSSLKYLNLGGVNLSSTGVSWLHHVNMLPSLLELHLSNCQIDGNQLPLSLETVNLTSLLVLDISGNYFINSSFPSWFFNLSKLSLISLEHLDLSGCELRGQLIPKLVGNLCKLKSLNLGSNNFDGAGISEFMSGFSNCSYNRMESLYLSSCGLASEMPASLGMFKHLQHLDLSYNSLWGSIPDSIGNLSSLKKLDLSRNRMNGSIPKSLGQLSELVNLYLSTDEYSPEHNRWQGILTEAHFINLTSLESFRVSTEQPMSLIFKMANDWVPPFKLRTMYIVSCRVGPAFPTWLQSQTQLVDITLRNSGISGTIPEDWLMKISSRVYHIDLSYNQIRGKLPLQYRFPHLSSLDLRHNHFDGTIPPSICDMLLYTLSLRNNQLTGEFPQAWSTCWSHLAVVDVSHNNLSGNIPSSLGIPCSLRILKMNNNKFGGEIPFSLQNCSELWDIDLGGNSLTGKLPSWIGTKLHGLQILQLRSNFLSGHIPKQLCSLQRLHILDLGHNNFSGTIPTCLNNLTSLVTGLQGPWSYYRSYYEQTTIISKGTELEYSIADGAPTLIHVTNIDLSSNNLEGEVPKEICSLIALGNLNLSRNQLTGKIPSMIGNLTQLETVDLSHNYLSGEIPQSISSLNFLSHLNLSCNNLSGRIPTGNQLQTLDDPSIYQGNPSLCGFPLNKCPGDDTPSEQPYQAEDGKDHENDNGKLGFYTSVVLGFVIGFWGVCGTLILKRSWRYAYFQFFDNMKDKVALAIALKIARYQREV
ncbi:hypothetical protein M0R45_014048 [Rubus argutus]|uniref:Non-specific serine/threonine protein kinase n=1 Tax=Rubus argutus TaxID=59490 RepID=A0AAW1XMZ6_RUBAR